MTTKSQAPAGRIVGHPVFSQPQPTADPTSFRVKHASDGAAYKEIDQLNREHKLAPLPFDPPRGLPEPRLTLGQVLGDNDVAAKAVQGITSYGAIVFHSTGDCGSTIGPSTQSGVTDKMVSDFDEAHPQQAPAFNLLLGDIVYSFGEAHYYYDQFYEPYREYPAPILAAAGNHDGMVSPLAHAKSLDAFYRNFCAPGYVISPDAGGLSRTAQIQPGVFFTFEAPFVRILVLYSNTLEDPGVIADGPIGTSQVDFLQCGAAAGEKGEIHRRAPLRAPPPSLHRGAPRLEREDAAGHRRRLQRCRRLATRRPGRARAQLPALHPDARSAGRKSRTSCAATAATACRSSPATPTLRAPQIIQSRVRDGRPDRPRELRRPGLRLPPGRGERRAAPDRIPPGQ